MRLTVERKNEILDKMKTCSSEKTYKLDPNDEEMIEAFKYIIREKQDINNGFELTFRDDYLGIKKTDWPIKTTVKPEQK